MAFPKTLSAAKADAFIVIGRGDSAAEAGFILSEEQLKNNEAALSAADTSIADLNQQVATLTKERDTAVAAKKTAEDKAAGLEDNVKTLTTERDNARAQAKEFGGKTEDPEATDKKKDPFDKKDKKSVKFKSDEHYEHVTGRARV